jgi:hypothetical protein
VHLYVGPSVKRSLILIQENKIEKKTMTPQELKPNLSNCKNNTFSSIIVNLSKWLYISVTCVEIVLRTGLCNLTDKILFSIWRKLIKYYKDSDKYVLQATFVRQFVQKSDTYSIGKPIFLLESFQVLNYRLSRVPLTFLYLS